VGGSSYAVEGIGDVGQLVRRNPSFDPQLHAGFNAQFFVLWNRIARGTTVKDLLLCGDVSPSHALVLLRGLLDTGAVSLGPPSRDDFEIVDQAELGALDGEEQALLAAEVQLEAWEKRRIVAVVRTLKTGNFFELLGVPTTASKRELKRAYYDLSKEFHPDRYYGKQLGPFGPLLERIFDTATHAVKVLADSRTVLPSNLRAGSPRRRTAPRYAFNTRVRVRIGEWKQVIDLVTQDIGDGGLFIPTEATARLGDAVALELGLPNGGSLRLTGTVAFTRGLAEAAHDKRLPGIGIKLEPLPPPTAELYQKVVEAARDSSPMPINSSPSPRTDGTSRPTGQETTTQRRLRLARGTGAFRKETPIIGIDLGTSYTSVAAALDNRISVIPWPDGSTCAPSVVSFPGRGRHVVGREARERLLTDPKHTVPSAKRLLGRRADERELEPLLAQAAYETQTGLDGSIVIEMWGEPYAIPQLVSYLLSAAKDAAERTLGQAVDRAVLTVPVSFTPERIEMMRTAGRLAHLEVLEVIDEPSAAALANRYRPTFGGLIGVYDFGGGTFDFSVVDATGGDFRVLATAGDSWLGGDDFDLAVAEAVANKFWQVHGVDLRNRVVEWQQLVLQVERAKRVLSAREEAMIEIPEVFQGASGPVDLRMRLSRRPVDKLWAEPIRRSLATCTQALSLLGLKPSDLEGIYLSGGTSYIPSVRKAIHEHFRVPTQCGVPPEFAACLGAGIHAAQIERRLATTLPTR
jgi:actin-like ATPase involved in cell morphogenesis/Tfp pilus assembly protein PilZ